MIQFPKFKNYKDQLVRYYQPKLDGHLVKINRGSNKIVVLTKNDKDITKKVWETFSLMEGIEQVPPHSLLFGELHCPGVKATSIPTLLNNRSEKLIMTVFAAPLLAAENLVQTKLTSVMERLNYYNVDTPFTITLTTGRSLSALEQEHLLDEAVNKKWEGWVLKQEHMKGWYKLKPTRTVDVFVIGVTKSFESTYYGGLKSIHVAVFNGDKVHDLGYVGSGFEVKYRQTVDRESLIDKVAEIEYDSLAADGKLRFPRFVRWRNDKDKKQCTFDQIEES